MTLFNSGSDYLTLTNVVGHEDGEPSLMPIFHNLAEASVEWRGGGYKGKADPDSGVKYGSRLRRDGLVDEVLIMPGTSSGEALEVIDDPLVYRVTRLDLQVTVLLDDGEENLASDLYDAVMKSKAEGANITKRRRVTLVKSSTGQTLYLGTRKTGRKFFRLYDRAKGAGCQTGIMWRQEIQYGRDLAPEALRRYLDIRKDGYATVALVCAEFQDAMGFSLHDHIGDLPEVVSSEAKKKPTLDAKLEWLDRCVKPTISLMIDNDLEQEMLYAIGLKHHMAWEKRQAKWKEHYNNN